MSGSTEPSAAGPLRRRGVDSAVLRNARAARLLHVGIGIATVLLMVSGYAVSHPFWPMTALMGGHAAVARWHRWFGFSLLGAGLLLPLARPRALLGFARETIRFRRSELRWFATWPGFVLRPSVCRPARHEGRFDPGQRLFSVVCVGSFAALLVTGVAMSVPEAVTSAGFAWSLRVHRLAAIVLLISTCGHVLIGSGILRGYRGVHRVAFGDGRVALELARTLWPRWAEGRETVGEAGGRTSLRAGSASVSR